MQPKPDFCHIFLARAPHLSMYSASPNEAKLKTVLASTVVQIPGRVMNSAELHPTLFYAVGSGRCCSHWGAVLFQCWGHTEWTWRSGAAGAACMSHMWLPYVQHVSTHQSTSWQTTYRSFQLTVVPLPPSWFCLVSLPSPLTVKQPRPPGSCHYRSKQFYSDILSRRGHWVFLRQR